jgi:hypothetical protein
MFQIRVKLTAWIKYLSIGQELDFSILRYYYALTQLLHTC